MDNKTVNNCILAIAEINPYKAKDIREVHDRCRSINTTINVVYIARRTKMTLGGACELMGISENV